MEEKSSKGISLRRKKTTANRPVQRPTISAPRQIPPQQLPDHVQQLPGQGGIRDASADGRNNSGWDAASGVRNESPAPRRPKFNGEQTSDLVKRRYSTRFANTTVLQDGNAPPIPAMPALAGNLLPGARAKSRDGPGRSPDRGVGRLQVDLRALKDPHLHADKYIQSMLADASEADIHAYQSDLHTIKNHTDTDLQHNVYQNRTQFIKISKEADKLKSEMRTLRSLMSELTGALGHATSAAGADLSNATSLSIADRKRANRSSVANLEAMWSTHLQTLWKRVEGSQKYLPALPGRHILMESQRWMELNAATWKPRRRVAMVLLNDHLLVASEKKRTAEQQANTPSAKANNRVSVYNPGTASQSTHTVLVADRCWPLHDVSLADISTTASSQVGHNHTKENRAIANAINIRAGNESFTYATADTAEKLGFMVAFRKAQEDQRKQIAAEHGEREKALDEFAMYTGRDPRLLKKVAAAGAEEDARTTGLSRSNSVLVDVDGRPQSVRWVESQIDGLDIDIALQRFEEAVARVETLRKMARGIKGNASAQEIILAKVNERATKLASSIARQLKQASSGAESTQMNVAWLLRLNQLAIAQTTYLAARTETMRLRQRQINFTGSLEPHVHALAFATFTCLLHTFRTFNASFPAGSGSAVVRWGKERVDEFNGMLGRVLGGVERGSEAWEGCVRIVREQASVLGEVGVDFGGLLGREVAKPGPGSVGLGVRAGVAV